MTTELIKPGERDAKLPSPPPTAGGALFAVVLALAYFLCPIDLVPDFLFGVGQLDDLGVCLWAGRSVMRFLKA